MIYVNVQCTALVLCFDSWTLIGGLSSRERTEKIAAMYGGGEWDCVKTHWHLGGSARFMILLILLIHAGTVTWRWKRAETSFLLRFYIKIIKSHSKYSKEGDSKPCNFDVGGTRLHLVRRLLFWCDLNGSGWKFVAWHRDSNGCSVHGRSSFQRRKQISLPQ